ncbi:helix-turn-helix domain-containing protein [Allonocardiopsis opalescens]|uniref:MerR-like DNA binding protein n=1 Tax=Allonocardiopsis opalescens TaxID=1144618 RepID=A0A2T0Q4C8_9ACTN|nr:helix-turn-helix domain-containing protein [Allonocardiopsis opalescens]PRX98654.1 MerR-like DNA binding protein [Allonocardiopsis opalescens]
MQTTWTIGELVEAAAGALADAAGSAARPNGRVSDLPSERLIRWYTTTGLLDPPLSRRGRQARYGRRHLLQLVAVKRLQSEGRSLAEIQQALAGATDESLARTAGLPADGAPPEARAPDDRPAPGRFWTTRPAEAAAEAAAGMAGALSGSGAALGYAVPLAPGVTLAVTGAPRSPAPEELAALAGAAAPLLDLLARHQLSAPPAADPRSPS